MSRHTKDKEYQVFRIEKGAKLQKYNRANNNWEEVYEQQYLKSQDIVRCVKAGNRFGRCELLNTKKDEILYCVWKDSTTVSEGITRRQASALFPGTILKGAQDPRIPFISLCLSIETFQNIDTDVFAVKTDDVLQVYNFRPTAVVCSLISVKDSVITDVNKSLIPRGFIDLPLDKTADRELCLIELYEGRERYIEFKDEHVIGKKLSFADSTSLKKVNIKRFDYISVY